MWQWQQTSLTRAPRYGPAFSAPTRFVMRTVERYVQQNPEGEPVRQAVPVPAVRSAG